MFLRATTRRKDGKVHRYWSIVENRRLPGWRVRQRHVLYLGEINSSREQAWRKSVDVFDERAEHSRSLALFPEDRIDAGMVDESVVRLCLSQLRLCRPRVCGSCWLALQLWETLELDRFWRERLPRSRKGTRWDQVLFVLVCSGCCYRAANGVCTGSDPAELWRYNIQLTQVEEDFKNPRAIWPSGRSTTRTKRGLNHTHLHRLPGLLPARHTRPATASTYARADAAQRA
jgi:hypothetical protein